MLLEAYNSVAIPIGLVYIIVLLTSYLVGVAIKNGKAYQVFKNNKPSIPEIPNKKLYSGHMSQICDGRVWLTLQNNHAKYGETVASFLVHRPTVSTIDLDLIKQIVIDEGDKHINRYKLDVPLDEVSESNIFYARDEQWRKIRKHVAPAFSLHKINSSSVMDELKQLVDRFVYSLEWRLMNSGKEKIGENKEKNFNNDDVRSNHDKSVQFAEIDVDDIMHRFSIDIVFTLFYKQPKVIDYYSDKDEWTEMVNRLVPKIMNPFTKLCLMFPILRPILTWGFLTFIPESKIVTEITRFIKESKRKNIQNRIKMMKLMKEDGVAKIQKDESDLASTELNGLAEHDANPLKDTSKSSSSLVTESKFNQSMLDYIIDRYYERKLTSEEFLHSSWMLFLAANMTTSDALSKIIYFLARHQDVQEKARASVRVHGTKSEYLGWVINETLRLCPPAHIGCSREITSDITCKSGVIPAGTFVHTPVHTIHRLKRYWGDDAEEFRPERWDKASTFHPVQFMPFGAGKRDCPGRHLAMSEMRNLFTRLLLRFKWESSPRTDHKQVMESFEAPALVTSFQYFPTYVRYRLLKEGEE